MHSLRLGILLAVLFSNCQPSPDESQNNDDQFSKHIRTVDARTPEDQQLGFKLPPGFKIELFAAEPNIGKPMNISFDENGRIWVTQSKEYPFYDSLGTGEDRISVLEDTNGDGKADKFITFADSLNIPIGVVPVADGAIAYSIPYVYHLIDTDGDDRVDKRKILLSGFEYKDTHGMINNFFRGLDGYIHADHGYSNISRVVGTDNNEPLVMNSGNTFRFLPDGSKLAFTTTGRVNPFGYATDEFGYMYSVDCHSSPIYQLIRGADYPHFGKQPTGIGFGPALMSHDYGSTALAGLEYYTGNQYPSEYQNNFYVGDVVKSRVYRGSMKMTGTTPVITWEKDFIISEDPWFRPVDVKLGPDGALYIADFYNRIIGHYEVALDHPGRDRSRGRIWRITYEPNQSQPVSRDLGSLDLSSLLELLNQPAINVRMQAADQVVDRFGQEANVPVREMLNHPQSSSNQFIHGMWILFRLDQLDQQLIETGLNHKDEKCRVHSLRILAELDQLDDGILAQIRTMLNQQSPHIKRAAVMALAKYPDQKNLSLLLKLQIQVPETDTHLRYVLRQCLRDQLRDHQVLKWANQHHWEDAESRSLADVLVGVSNYGVVPFLSKHIITYEEPLEKLVSYVNHVARFLPASEQNDFVKDLMELTDGDLDAQYQVFRSLEKGITQAGGSVLNNGEMWAIEIAKEIFSMAPVNNLWTTIPVSSNYNANPWSLEQIETSDGEIKVLVSGPKKGPGIATSALKSPGFPLSGTLNFTLLGTKQSPADDNEPIIPTNWVALYRSGEDKPVYQVDITKPNQRTEVSWVLDTLGGVQGYLQIRDASQQWDEFIAIGRLDHPSLSLPGYDPSKLASRQRFACKVTRDYQVKEFNEYLKELLTSQSTDLLVRDAAAEAILAMSTTNGELVSQVAANPDEPELLRWRLLTSLLDTKSPVAYQSSRRGLKNLSFGHQKSLVLLMAEDQDGINEVLDAARTLDISPKLLLEPQISSLLDANADDRQKASLVELTKDLQPFSQEIQQEIVRRMIEFNKVQTSVELGAQIYQQHCATCHQIQGDGGNIGPQLDGIGNWGQHALMEKILDPNRNISKAFITYDIELQDGRSRQGLYRRDEGNLRIFADAAGQEFSLPVDEIRTQKPLPFTLMPSNFSETIPEEDFYHLMKFLVNQN